MRDANGSSKRMSSGVKGLDDMIGGGFLPGDATLVAGSPGTGKTTFGLHFIAAGVAAGEPGVFVTFEYLPQQIYRDAAKRGWPLDRWEKEGRARLVCTTPEVLLADEGGTSILDDVVREVGAKRLVIDSMAHFEFSSDAGGRLRERIAGLMNHLRLLDVTTLVTHEIPQIVGPAVSVSSFGLEFLVDNVIVLRYVELEAEMQKAINVLKFRGGDHDRKFRPLRQTENGISITSEFRGVENISLGSARRSLAQRAQDLI